jgi:hypothetical protein
VPVDVVTEIEIARRRVDVADYAADPDNATAWYENIKSVEWQSSRPLAVGTRLAFVAQFIGRRLVYTYEVVEFVPAERFGMHTAQGPFPMETTYVWKDAGAGATDDAPQPRRADRLRDAHRTDGCGGDAARIARTSSGSRRSSSGRCRSGAATRAEC